MAEKTMKIKQTKFERSSKTYFHIYKFKTFALLLNEEYSK